MAQLAFAIAVLALGGAVTGWIAGAWYYARVLRMLSSERGLRGRTRLAVLFWPFAIGRIRCAVAADAAEVNKAFVSVFACLTIAAAAASVAINLTRMVR